MNKQDRAIQYLVKTNPVVVVIGSLNLLHLSRILHSAGWTRVCSQRSQLVLRELLADPLLASYAVVIVDAYDRDTYTDILLSLLKKVLVRRPELRVVVTSYTHELAEFLNAKIVQLDCIVDTLYLAEPAENYVDKTIKTVLDVHNNEPPGDIVVFMATSEQVKTVMTALQHTPGLIPLHDYDDIDSDSRKVVVTTTAVSTHFTYIIDCGFVALRVFDKTDSILILPVSAAIARQRLLHAHISKPSKCFRLYPAMPLTPSYPAMQRSNLCGPVLLLKALGVNIVRMDLPSPPPVHLLASTLDILHSLKAIDDEGNPTANGRIMAQLPLDYMLASAVVETKSYEMLTIAAMLSVDPIFLRQTDENKKFIVNEGDLLTLYNVYQAFTIRGNASSKWASDRSLSYTALMNAVTLRSQLVRILERLNVRLSTSSTQEICKAIVSACYINVARMQTDGTFKVLGTDVQLHVHQSSVMYNRQAEYIVYTNLIEGSEKVYVNGVTTVDRDLLLEAKPDYFRVSTDKRTTGRVDE